MIEIKRNNKVFYTLEDVCEGSKMSRQLMDHHYIVLKFTTKEPVYFEIGDSVEIADFGYFELTSAYFPKFNEEMGGYDYELQMDAYYMAWKNKLCKYRPQYGANETSFKLTTTVDVHLKVILNNLKALGLKYNGNDFTADYTTYNKNVFDVQKRFYIEYGSISIIDALNAICGEDALDCEWWIDGSIIYLGYCEMVGQTTFEQGVNMVSMSQSESKSTFITRLYAFGSDKNIPTGYFTGSDVDVTTDGIATDYLMLPDKEVDEEGFYCKSGYIENVNVVKNDKQAIEGVVMFDDEYPKVNCKVSDIRTYDSTVENDDGTKTTETFWQVTSTDSFAMNFTTSWIKRNLTLMIKFTSGALLGMEFEVSFKIIGQRNYFEIVANENYGRKLPDADLCPKIGDEFFLYNWDASKITDTQLIPEAQEALYERAKTYYKKAMIDNSNFTCTMDGEKFFNHGTYDYHPLGEQVKLINPMFVDTDKYGKHYRNSRIIGMEICLDIPYDSPQYIVGEKASYSKLGQLEDKVDSIIVNGIQIGGVGSGGNGVYVIGMNDVTPASDSNVYSARRVNLSFLSKLYPDTAQELITFAKGLVSNVLAKLNGGMTIGEDGAGINELGEAVLESIRSLDYDNATETGFSIAKDANGRYHQFITNLTIWGKAVFHELEVRKLSYAGGNIYLSGAGSKIVKVVPVVWDDESSEWHESSNELCEGWQCYLLADDGTTATQNQWKVGDQARCRTIGTLKSGTTTSSNKSYWRTIMEHGVSEANEKIYADDDTTELYGGQGFAWIVLGKHTEDLDGYTEETAPTETKDYPSEGDTIVLDGSRTDTSRQGVLIFESTGEGTPMIVGLHGISDYTHDGKSTYVLSYDGVEMAADSFKFIVNGTTYTLSSIVQSIDGIKAEVGTMQQDFKDYKASASIEARKIALEVSEGMVSRRNLLGETQFLRQSAYWQGNDSYRPRISVSQGFGGTNAVKVVGESGQHSQGLNFPFVPIADTRTYTVSVLAKMTVELGVSGNLLVYILQRNANKEQISNTDQFFNIDISNTPTGEWYQFTKTFSVHDDAKYIDVVFFINGTTGTVYFCRPMLEEGDTFGGWTPSKLDYDYVGGNMLDDTRTLSPSSQSSNLEIYESIAVNTYEGAYAVAYGKADDSNANMDDFLRFSGENIRLLNFEKGKDYVLSFLAKGSGQLNTYLYNNNHQNVFAENVDGDDWHSTGDGCTWVQLSSEWKRYWVHWRIEDYIGDGEEVLPKWVLFRAISGCEAWVTQPKLEEGAVPSDYTEKKTDLIDRTTAKQAGLEITADGVLLYGDKVSVRNDGKTAAMFKDGSINADLINADTLNIHHVWAKDKENQNTLAHFGNYGIDEAKDTDGNQCPLWVGSSTASDAPFRVSKNGYMYANKGAFGVDYTENEGDDDETVRYGKFVIGDYDIHTGHEGASKCMSLSYEQLYFRNGTKRNFVYVGNNVGPVPGWGTSTNSAIRIDMLDGSAKDGNIAIHVDVENGPRNYAMIGTGDLSLNGFASGFKHTLIALPTANTIMMLDKGDISNTTCIITTSVSGAGITLPTLEAIQNMLGIGTDVKFCVRFTLVADIGTTTYSVYGRNDNRSGSAYPWNTNQLPIIFNWDGGYVSYFNMAAGDAYDFLLTYDPDKSYTVGSFTQPYVARIINRQN